MFDGGVVADIDLAAVVGDGGADPASGSSPLAISAGLLSQLTLLASLSMRNPVYTQQDTRS